MIAPSPTTKIDPTLARGVFGEAVAATATKPAFIKFCVPNTSYELHLRPTSDIKAQPWKRLIGVIGAEAQRVDVTQSGGQFIEPVIGRPRRIQGTIIAIANGQIVIDAAVPIHCTLMDERQSADKFAIGQFVGCDIKDGATFRQV